MLMKNLQLNALENKSTIVPLALTSKDEVNYLYQHQSGMVEGGASTSFNEKFNEINSKISLPGISADTLLNNFKLKKPDYIKIDVDGNEVDILLGIKNVIKDVKSVLIEIDSRLENNTKIYALLSNCNLSIKSEHIYDKNVKYQIWE
jgi:FkbM family methyltransferase